MTHRIIDIFAGPGGLSEGFASLIDSSGNPVFEISVSAEMEASAHATLSLRALSRIVRCLGKPERLAYRALLDAASNALPLKLPELAMHSSLAAHWEKVASEVLRLTLGEPSDNRRLQEVLEGISRKRNDALVLIGGPPCQAYSLVGRARNRGVKGYRPEADKRHFLYEQYLAILQSQQPDVFIMENVKGILSSEVGGNPIFERILDDLSRPGGKGGPRYELVALAADSGEPSTTSMWIDQADFIVRAERHGIPQARHRVIIAGVRDGSGASKALNAFSRLPECAAVNVEEVLSDLPKLRSGLSKSDDSPAAWKETLESVQAALLQSLRKSHGDIANALAKKRFPAGRERSSTAYAADFYGSDDLRRHYRRSGEQLLRNHETRGHMKEDLARYLFCAVWGQVRGRSPTSGDFPKILHPQHKSWSAGHFADRFRVQLPHLPSNTVTSHLAKDGHQFIHWDAEQCRSLTVREAARLQTFPDDYVFLGNRTQQYTQVGNAVPPWLARAIAKKVCELLES